MPLQDLTIRGLAGRIAYDWKNVWFGAKPYLAAMHEMDSVDTPVGLDSGRDVILRFLCNAGHWRGAVAREIKKELKRRTAT